MNNLLQEVQYLKYHFKTSNMYQNTITPMSSLAYLGHFVMAIVTLLRRYVIEIMTNLESLKCRFMSCGNCDEIEQTSQERHHR